MPVIVLDRDGVINQDSKDYIKSAEEWQPLPGSIEAIAFACRKGYRVYVATNQAGLARGLFQETDLEAMHSKLHSLVSAAGGKIQAILHCPHHPEEGCRCRKPAPGMLEQIETLSGESMQGQPFVGDSMKDLQAAQAIAAKPILVRTGNGLASEKQLAQQKSDATVFDSLSAFVDTLADVN